jgi:pimeloyl-ACP methyl ester carboxylesterase
VLYAKEHPERVERLLLVSPISPAKTRFFEERMEKVNALIGSAGVSRMNEIRQRLPQAGDDEAIALCREWFGFSSPPYFVKPEAFTRERSNRICDAPPASLRNRFVVVSATLGSLGDWDFRPDLRRLQMPALVVEGAKTNVPLDATREWAATMPNARLLLIPDAGHVHFIEQPAAFFSAAEQFFAGKFPKEAEIVRTLNGGNTSASATTRRISVSPKIAPIDESISIRLDGFKPNARVTIRAQMMDDSNRTWESKAEFRTDKHGTVNVDSEKPLAGTYSETDPTGLFWSMNLAPDEKQVSPFNKQTLAPTIITFAAEGEGKALASAKLERLFVAPAVKKVAVREEGLAGTLFLPGGSGPHPGLIVVGGSGGGLREHQAALFASHGYAAFALAYFKFEHLPDGLVNLPLEYFETAIRWVQAQKEVRADKLALIGTSRGGELALLAGATFPQIKAVVAYAPSSVVWGGVTGEPGDVARPSWTYSGTPIPFIARAVPPAEVAEKPSQEPVWLAPSHLLRLADPEAVRRAAIPVENIKGPVLLLSGEDDKIWPSSVMAEMVMKRLTEHKHPYPFKHLSYKATGHFRETLLPNLPTTILGGRHAVRGYIIEFGGNAKDTAHAANDSWQQALKFLHESLR